MKWLFIIIFPVIATGQVSVSKDTVLMGSSFAFTAIAESEAIAWKSINKGILEVGRIEQLISSWDASSQTTKINKQAGNAPVKVDFELYQLISRAKKVSVLSNGYFDISFASINHIWNFSKPSISIPNQDAITKSVELIDYRNILLNEKDTTVFLKQKGMKIGFGAIGKGYAANQAKKIMIDQGAASGVVNAGGDLISWGKKPEGHPWSIGITDPDDDENIVFWINSSDQAVVTSGNYESYFDIDGKRYCHIINPITGWPAINLKSVTVICPDAELADALATTTFILGVEDGLALINHLEGIECVIIDENNALHFSTNLNPNLLSHE
ncbi:MAG: FAD:protein FMN transferase [Flavobacteriales bacterium]|nr:FAD:protein FMN transferase [Flavobacteriales bacterium]